MISTLYILQENIVKFLEHEDMMDSKKCDSFESLCKQAMTNMPQIYRQYVDINMAEQASNQCYTLIIHLLDQLTLKPNVLPVFNLVKDLLQLFEYHYGHHIKSDNGLPHYEQENLKGSIAKRLPDIIHKLKRKSVPVIFLDELNYSVNSLFHPSKMPDLCYHHRNYLPKLLDALENMAEDKRSKPWTDRFINLLVNFNFNYMGFYNRWEDMQNEQFEVAIMQGNIDTVLLQLEMELNRYGTNYNLAFNPSHKTLLNYMQNYLQLKKKLVKIALQNNQHDIHSYIPLNINGNETKLFFHAGYAVNLFTSGNKEETAKTVAPNIRTQSGIMLTYQSLGKYDKDKLAPQANAVIRKLKAMTKFLENDFR